MATITTGSGATLNTDQLNLSKLLTGTVTTRDATHITFTYSDGSHDDLYGSFSYSAAGALSGGTITQITSSTSTSTVFTIASATIPVSTFLTAVQANDSAGLRALVLSGSDRVTGSTGSDTVRTYAGADVIVASGGTDVVDGGDGADVLVLNSVYSNYRVSYLASGSWQVTDTRSGSPDGVITTTSVETLQFADSNLTSANVPTAATVARLETAFTNVTRYQALASATPDTVTLADGSTIAGSAFGQRVQLLNLAGAVDAGTTTLTSALSTIADFADATTSVASLTYNFFTGKTPTSAGFDYLVNSTTNATDLNDAYYAKFTLENRYINFAVNLGRYGEGAPSFTSTYGSLTLAQAAERAYTVIFGAAPEAGKISAILDASVTYGGITATRADYFAVYGGDGLNGIGTKAALVGWLLSEGVKADIGTYAKANEAFLTALENGTAQYNVDLVGTYGTSAFVSDDPLAS